MACFYQDAKTLYEVFQRGKSESSESLSTVLLACVWVWVYVCIES